MLLAATVNGMALCSRVHDCFWLWKLSLGQCGLVVDAEGLEVVAGVAGDVVVLRQALVEVQRAAEVDHGVGRALLTGADHVGGQRGEQGLGAREKGGGIGALGGLGLLRFGLLGIGLGRWGGLVVVAGGRQEDGTEGQERQGAHGTDL